MMNKSVKKICICLFSLLLAVTIHAAELTGTWEGTEDTGEPYTFVFSAVEWSMTQDSGMEWQEGTYTFNGNADPKQLDLYVTAGSYNQMIAQTALYIYKINGNTLTLTGSEPGSTYRPSDFSEGSATRTFILGNEAMETNDDSDDTTDCDDCNKARVYINCFVRMLGE